MKTKFITLESKIVTKTVFTHFVNGKREVTQTVIYQPINFKNVLHIGWDEQYGDTFKCWNDELDTFSIYFGTKGDEFNQ